MLVRLLVATGGAHAAVAVVAFAAWLDAADRCGDGGSVTVFAPLPLLAPTAAWRLLVAVTASTLALVAFVAASRLARLRPRSRQPATSAAWLSLLNPPVGTLLGLVALAHLDAPDVRAILEDPDASE